ncbi:hypothetical protein H632_c4564p0 [Helicosporidium sp. ATCC 50920]|nr:hypothetical protein H632_c4564p0 [Helicosporidium sp. ATCC 50920]|eukprot:KDD71687.1 hypothetical protein H632_c4564p0 [Helicosporidium sp. ATCC 50920]
MPLPGYAFGPAFPQAGWSAWAWPFAGPQPYATQPPFSPAMPSFPHPTYADVAAAAHLDSPMALLPVHRISSAETLLSMGLAEDAAPAGGSHLGSISAPATPCSHQGATSAQLASSARLSPGAQTWNVPVSCEAAYAGHALGGGPSLPLGPRIQVRLSAPPLLHLSQTSTVRVSSRTPAIVVPAAAEV